MKMKICSIAIAIGLMIGCFLALPSCSSYGHSGIVDATINEQGELIFLYGDGSEQNLGVVVGKDGADGKDGVDGKDGIDGQDGADGENGIDGKDGKDGSGGSVVIQGDGGNIALASSKGLRSSVSIVCNFQTTVQQGGWRPGSGSSSSKQYSSGGSGVIYQIDKDAGDAFIITNYHVVYNSSSNTANGISDDISVYLYGSEVEKKAITATYVGGSLYYDIAVLFVEGSEILKASDACAVEFADSDGIIAGQNAIAVGNAQGMGISVSSGVISVDSEYITMTAVDGKSEVSFRVIRVDTAVNSGNSGGGLFDSTGKLIGIVNAKFVEDGVESIGYAIPSNVALAIAENIIDYCFGTELESVQRALLGITLSASDSRAVYNSEMGRIAIVETVSVYEVNEGSLAEGVLQEGDVLVSADLNGKKTVITRQYHVIDMMLSVRVGDEVVLSVLRDGEEMTVSITITEECLTAY